MVCNTRNLATATTALALAVSYAHAHAQPSARWLAAPGFQAVAPDRLEGRSYYSAARFPGQGASAFHPDADLPAPVRALLLLESHEGTLPHARYLVSYQPTSEAATPDDTRDLVDITRFNLGPAVRADLVDSVPAEHLGTAKMFGVGPHVRWRLAMSPRRGMSAGLDAVGRKVVSDQEADAMDCLGLPCAALPSAEGPQGPWKAQRLEKLPPAFARSTEQGPAPASVVEHLLVAMGEDALRAAPFAPDAQRLVFVVSVNAGGQESQTTALARNALVFDDAVGTHWLRFAQTVGTGPQVQTLSQRRK